MAGTSARGYRRRMPFFDPLPPELPQPAPDQPSGWRPPLWDRPSEALLGAPVGAVLLLAKTEQVAIAIDNIHAYPNGFGFSLAILSNPMMARDPSAPGPMGFGHPLGHRGPRIGFEFSDGSRAQEGGPSPLGFPSGVVSTEMLVAQSASEPQNGLLNPFGFRTGADGMPTEPVLMSRGGGGSGERFEMRMWCYPLPPLGRMTIFVEWADQGIDETAVPFDAETIHEAVPRVITIWESEP
jgi:hypothetical protein